MGIVGTDYDWFNYTTNSGLLRCYSMSLFSSYGRSIGNGQFDARFQLGWHSRAVVVVGSGV